MLKRRPTLLLIGAASSRPDPPALRCESSNAPGLVRAQHVHEALTQLADRSVDAVLIDVSAFRGDLRGAIERLRRGAPQTPIVLLGPPGSRRGARIAHDTNCAWLPREASPETLLEGIPAGPAAEALPAHAGWTEGRLRDFVDSASDFFWEMDERLRITFVSERFCEVTGRKAEEVVGKTVKELGNPGVDAHGWHEHLLELEAHTRFRNFLMPSRPRAQGSSRSISISGKPVFDGEGRFAGYRGTGTDVTELVRARRESEHKSHLLEAILENLNQGVSLVDAELKVQAFNRRFLELLDFPGDRFQPGVPFEAFIRYNAERGEYGPGDLEALVRERVERARRHEPHRFERLRPDGTLLEVQGRPLSEGGFVTTYTDITQYRRAQEEARSSEQRYRDLFENAPIGIWDEDYSGVKRILDQLKAQGVEDLETYLDEHHDVLRRLAKVAVLRDFNSGLLKLYRTEDRDEVLRAFSDPESWVRWKHYYVKELSAFASGQTRFAWEGNFHVLDGSEVTVRIVGRIPDEHADTWSRVITTEEEITDRRRAEEAVARARQTLSDAIESMPGGFALFATDDRLLMCNQRYRSLFPKTAELRQAGVSFATLLQACVDRGEFVLPEGMTNEEAVTARTRAWQTGLPFEWRTSAGRWVEIRDSFTEDGMRVSVCVDLTARKSAENRLSESEERYRQLFENASSAVLVLDAETLRLEDANPAALALYGYSREEFLKLTAPDISAEPEKSRVAIREVAAGTTGPAVIPERHHKGKSGRAFPVEISAGTFVSHGRLKVISSIHDISERKRAEDALRAGEARLRAIIDGNPDGMLVINEKREVDFINRAAEALFGREEAQLVGERLGFIGSGEAKEVEVLRPDGDTVVCELRAVEARSHGKPVQIVAIRDVTERHRAEQAIESLAKFHSENPNPLFRITADGAITEANAASRELLHHWDGWRGDAVSDEWRQRALHILSEGRSRQTDIEAGGKVLRLNLVPVTGREYVNVYGEDITEQKAVEQRLRQAQKMEAIGQLTGGVAHDFNNRLTVIMGNLELLLRQMPGDAAQCQKLAEAAHDAAGHGAKLTRQLLAFSRRQVLEPKSVDLNEQIEAMPGMLTRVIGDNIEFCLSCDEKLWYVKTDQGQLQDALLNLILNARDAMPDGGALMIEARNVSLTASDAQEWPYADPGDYVMLAVGDTGAGMSTEVRERVFDPFYTTKGEKGTGLGLSMVYGFVKQSRGFVEIESELGRGTKVQMYLPRHEPTQTRTDVSDEQTLPRSTRSGAATVLVVEDDDTVRKIAVAMLKDLGYGVLEARCGPDAVEVLEEAESVDLLFTDMVMPGGMSAFELAERAAALSPGIKVLYTSGYSDEGPFGDVAVAQGVNWLNKPYDRRGLADKVRTVLGESVS